MNYLRFRYLLGSCATTTLFYQPFPAVVVLLPPDTSKSPEVVVLLLHKYSYFYIGFTITLAVVVLPPHRYFNKPPR